MDIVVCITGASGAVYAVNLLEHLKKAGDVVIHLVCSNIGLKIVKDETGTDEAGLEALCDHYYGNTQLGAPIASGSVRFDALVLVPATMSTVSKIAVGISDNLITRTASVALKERRRFITVFREAPLSTVHLENLTKLSQNGVIMMPAAPGFYNGPETITDLVDGVSSRVMDLLGIENDISPRYTGE